MDNDKARELRTSLASDQVLSRQDGVAIPWGPGHRTVGLELSPMNLACTPPITTVFSCTDSLKYRPMRGRILVFTLWLGDYPSSFKGWKAVLDTPSGQ